MTNYYEKLGIDPSASGKEIELIIDQHYERLRQLVTHHDPAIVLDTNKSLIELEKIRETLMDPNRRKSYDAQYSQNIGGLVDPKISNQIFAPPRPGSVNSKDERLDAWICINHNCQKANPINTIHCRFCGTEIGIYCPKCGTLTEKRNKFCQNCGVNLQIARIENEKQEQINQIEYEKNLQRIAEFDRLEKELSPLRKKANFAKTLSSFWWILLGGISGGLWIIALIFAISVLNSPQVHNSTEIIVIANKARKRATINLVVAGVFSLVAILITLISN